MKGEKRRIREEDMTINKSEASFYILIGREDEKTQIARKLLDAAGLNYRFAHADISEEPLPQLVSGLNTFIGLEQISRVAAWAQHNNDVG